MLLRIALLLALVTGCAHGTELVPPAGFHHALGRDHPLSGRVYLVAEKQLVDPARLFAAVRASRVIVLGETHDHADHHALQARLLDAFLAAHGPGSVAFEMLDETQAPGLSPAPKTADELAARVNWAESGWPEFALYRPVFEVALAHGARIVAAHPSREHLHVAMHSEDASGFEVLRLAPPLPDAAQRAIADEIRESHCGHAPDAMLAPMQRGQTFKDAWMAYRVAQAGAPAALIAGRGHTRKDYGVPVFLARQGVRDVITIAFLEVDDARAKPEQYELAPYDFVVFTPRVTDESACERFRAQLEQMRAQGSAAQ